MYQNLNFCYQSNKIQSQNVIPNDIGIAMHFQHRKARNCFWYMMGLMWGKKEKNEMNKAFFYSSPILGSLTRKIVKQTVWIPSDSTYLVLSPKCVKKKYFYSMFSKFPTFKDQLISKWLFDVINFLKKSNTKIR